MTKTERQMQTGVVRIKVTVRECDGEKKNAIKKEINVTAIPGDTGEERTQGDTGKDRKKWEEYVNMGVFLLFHWGKPKYASVPAFNPKYLLHITVYYHCLQQRNNQIDTLFHHARNVSHISHIWLTGKFIQSGNSVSFWEKIHKHNSKHAKKYIQLIVFSFEMHAQLIIIRFWFFDKTNDHC